MGIKFVSLALKQLIELRKLKVTMYVIELENDELETLTMAEIEKKLNQLKFQELLNQSSFSTKQRVLSSNCFLTRFLNDLQLPFPLFYKRKVFKIQGISQLSFYNFLETVSV